MYENGRVVHLAWNGTDREVEAIPQREDIEQEDEYEFKSPERYWISF